MAHLQDLNKARSKFLTVLNMILTNFTKQTNWKDQHVKYTTDQSKKHNFYILVPSTCAKVWQKIDSMNSDMKISTDIFVKSLSPYIKKLIESATVSVDIAMILR